MPTRERPKRSEVQTPGNTPTRRQRSVSPAAAKIKIEGRRTPDNIYVPRKQTAPKGKLPEGVKALTAPGFASNTVSGAANIEELARALKNDVDLIFQFVYENIEFIPIYGSQKGGWGSLIDGFGGSFDQTELLIELLREAGFTCSFQSGEIELTEAAAQAWLGTDSIWASTNLLGNCGVPNETHWTGTEWKLRVAHCWAKVTIDSTDYFFDPSMKSYTVAAASIDLETALDYDRTEFMTDATDGATITSDYVEDMNRTNVRNNLATLAGNLVDYIKTNAPTATLEDVLGGRTIDPISGPVRDTALPYLRPGSTPDTWSDIPNAYKATLSVLYDDPNIDVTFYSKDIHGKRLTMTFNGSHECELRLDGDLIATSDPQIEFSWNSVLLTITHPYADPWWDQSFWQTLWEGHPYMIAQAWGNAGRKMVEVHRAKLSQSLFDGDAPTDENVIGETLALWFNMWNTQKSWACDVFNRMTNCTTVLQHQLGLVGHFDTPTMDLGGIMWSTGSLDNNYPDSVDTNDTALAMHGIAFEAGAIEQICGVGGISTTTIIDKAVQDGLKIYDGRDDNWTSDVRPNLTNYDSQTLDDIENWYINWDWRIAIPEDGEITKNDFIGYGYYAISPWYGAIGIFSGYLQGGMGDEGISQGDMSNNASGNSTDPNSDSNPHCTSHTSAEPIDLLRGTYLYRNTDLTVGSGKSPYQLAFERSYTSGARLRNGPLGLGWSHNWSHSVAKNSDGLLAMATESPISGAAGLAAMFVTVDLYRDLAKPMDKWVTVAMTNRWLLDQSRDNTAIVSLPGDTEFFVRLPDGTYASPVGHTSTLTQNVGGDWTYVNKQQVETSYNSSGQITEVAYPYGMTITMTYSSGKLVSVANNTDRELTLSYTGDLLTGVSDGNGRSVEFAFDVDGNLETVTDAEENDTVYAYDIPGRMTQIFLPANPMDAIVTNVYDSLGRVKQQTDGSSNTWLYYFAGPRSEEEDPEGNSRVLLLNRHQNVVREIDALGNAVEKEYDGLHRLIKTTFPEGNSRELAYDEMNNVLTITDIAKPGSGLSNIVRTMSYDPNWNTVATSEDGRGNVTTFTYDAMTGQIVSIEYPEVDSVIPTVEIAYNARGQAISRIDQMGVQTQFAFDGTTEVLLSKIVNTNWLATIGGTITVNDVVSIIVHDSGLAGGQKTKSYTVLTGNDLSDVAAGLATAINGDSEITDLGITAKARGETISLSTAPGNATTFTSSTSGGATETVGLDSGLELQTGYNHDAEGNVTELTDPKGNTTLYDWDDMRRLTKVTAPVPIEYESKVTYDENGNRTKLERFAGLDGMSQPIWQTTQWTYTVDNQVATMIDAASHTTEFTYNTRRKLWKREDAANRVTEFLYDEVARLETTIDPSSVVAETRTYSDNGLVASLEDANENVTEFEYDGFDRLKKRIFADTTFEQFTRDQNGNITAKVTRAGDTINLVWDALNRLTSKDPDNLPTVSYDYDLANRLLHVSKPVVSGDPSSGEIKFTWDAAGRLLKEEYPDSKQVQYEVDENGNVTRLTYPDSYYVERIFDELNRLTGVKLNGAGSNAVDITYDPLSRRSTLDYDNGTSSEYGFAALNNLMTSLDHNFDGSSVAFGYGFNNVDELISQSVDDNAYLWHPSIASTIAYDPANELNQYPEVDSAAYSYNNNGCLTDDGVWTFAYDTENRLISADDGVTSASYLYDPLNRQAQKEVNSAKTRFIYSGWQRIADYDGSNNLIARYVYGASLDEPLIRVAAGGGLTYMHNDRIGSIVAVSDNTGAVTNVYKYTPWGESPNMSGTTFGFTGQRFDSETGLYYFKNRYYSPKLGRFLQPDAALFVDGLNIYEYAKNNPMSFSDPLGFAADGSGSCSCDCGGGSGGGSDPGSNGSGQAGQLPPPPDGTVPPPTNLESGFDTCTDAACCTQNGVECISYGGDWSCCSAVSIGCIASVNLGIPFLGVFWDPCFNLNPPFVLIKVDDYYTVWDGVVRYARGCRRPLVEICFDGHCQLVSC